MDDFNASSSNNIDKEEVIKSTKAKMGEVKEENERLKRLLAQLVTDYKSLEHQILSISKTKEGNNSDNYKGGDNQDHDLVSLTLGRCLNNGKFHVDDARNKIRKIDGGLVIDLDRKVENYQATNVDDSIKNSTQDLKTKDKKIYKEGDEESLYETQLKKTRVCIRSRCDTPTMNDGCHWRKYGQKIAKGNPCPRAYYRCTISTTCPVRKQVQRCVDDMSILLTTYEGTHNHPLPLSATAMASATSAAASMIKTSASTSQQPLLGSTTSSSFGLHSSTLINLLHPNHNPNPRITISNPSMISSSSHAHPTVTLDLTTPNHTTLSSSPSFNTWLSSSSNSSTIHPSNNFLDFSSSTSSSTCSSSSGFSSWASGYFNSQISSANKNNNPTIMLQNISPSSDQSSLNEMITKAIASNPTFQSVLAAAISSYYVGTTTDNKASNDMKKSPLSTRSGSKEDHASDDDRIS